MRYPRFRLKTLMILVFASALVCAAWARVSRMDEHEVKAMHEGAIVLVPFLLMVAMKLGLVVAARARRAAQGEPGARDEPLP